MKGNNERESLCEFRFRNEGPYWHIWSSENHPIIFVDKSDFMAAMNIMGIAARLCSEVRIITFEWMSNHLHIVAAGKKEDVIHLQDILKRLMIMHFRGSRYDDKACIRRAVDLSGFSLSFRELGSLSEVRNVIAYDNRNGYLVSPDESPYSYPWGANRYYFNPDAKMVYESNYRRISIMENRRLIYSHLADGIKPLNKVFGYACPMSFCYISDGEQLFASASQYFHAVSKSVESYKTIADELAESIFLTDEEMYSAASSIALSKYQMKLVDLDNTAKMEVASILHFNYNSSNKQIARILKLPQNIVDTIFPKLQR